ncbi:protocadherin Fat 4-like [Saccostrea echinata]|uniref:protocadherin Fat 4-like n=1 Tax=Saccostrea echinata TaxID=191078 RepID=UPI002A8301F8|nr:protocadherin Fat 4-like [Saccostrea echinata]
MEISVISECAKCGYTPARKRWTAIVLVLLQFLVTYAQGQGPGTNFSVYEGRPPGTRVGFLSVQSSYSYTFNEPQPYFSLNPTTGEISTRAEIDRELLSSDRLNILVISRPPGDSSQIPIDIYITVLDINDNSPTFPQSPVNRDISEKANIGYSIRLDTATDRDINKNGNVTNYQIVARNDDNKFRTVFDPSKFGQVLYLELTSGLDREEKDSYEITIRANDQGDMPLYGDLIVKIKVTDTNDNPPIFSMSQYTATVNESSPIDTLVIRVDATDDDIGDNGNIFYTLTDESQQFKIDERTGEIRTTRTPLRCNTDCGGSQPCSSSGCIFLTLEAQDGGSPALNGRAYVTVSIKDENDHAPTINIIHEGSVKNYISVNETAKNGDYVAAITVSDADTGISANISSVKIITGNELNHFRLHSSFQYKYNALLVNVDSLDRERIDMYNLTIQAVDMGSPPKIGTKNLIIVVADVNEFPPTFLQRQYVANVLETLPVGSFVANLVAEDRDSGINAKLTYKILSGNNHGWFEINPHTGLVTLRKTLKYNLASEVVMNISAQDGASVPLTSYTKLTVRISDENDVTPTFNQSSYQVHLPEGQQLGTVVISLTALDTDSGPNGTVVYSFHPEVQELYPDTFNVNPQSGRVITLTKLDREKVNHYVLRVIATDQSVLPLSSTATVYLTVDDVNDNVPVFYPQKYFANVLKSTPSGSKVVKVNAVDPDQGEGGRIFYSFPNDYPEFVLDTNTGWISTTYEFERSSQQEYTLKVTCRDTNTVHRASVNADVKITVVTSLSSLPVFTKDNYQFTVMENLGENQILGSVAVSSGASLSYAITDGDYEGNFKINDQGEISTTRLLDREYIPSYELTVTATGQGGSANVKVFVIVQDKNDNKPKFKYNSVDVDLKENSAVGHEVYYAFAKDEDSGSNGLVTYTLTANSNLFKVNPNSGMITLTRPYQKIYGMKFDLKVIASDSGSPSNSASMNITVHVTDVNDHNPVFPKTDYAITLEESTLVNTQFHTLTATDADMGRNAYLIYNITRGNDDGKFGIFPNGKLYIAKPLDRETRDLYKLTVMAQDHGIPPRSSEVNVTIHILDSNDNRPRFLNQTYSFYVSENVPPGEKIGAVKALDADIGRNAELAFLLSEDQDNFTIDFQTGEITTLRTYDREALISETGKDYYSVEVTVMDNGVKRQEDTITAHIYILDQNDNPPHFDRDIYRTSVKENMAKYSFVYKVTATDLDIDENAALTYTIIEGNTDDMFNINPGSGQISLNGNLDTETLDLYSLKVQAADNGRSKTFTSSATVIINILDINDNTPLFHLTVYEVNIPEDTRLGEKLIQVTADDTDLGINAEIEYSLSESNNTFKIDSHNGNIYLNKLVDFETKKLYSVKVIATDKGDPRLSSEADLNVRIVDVNDNYPEFLNDFSVLSISENTQQFASIAQISASDKDNGLNGKVEYLLVNQDPPGNDFKINKDDGRLRLETKLDREKVALYMLTVVASDLAPNGSQRLTSEKMFSIHVLDENDNAPILNSAPALTIQYPTSTGHIGTIHASDPDYLSNGTIVFQLLGGMEVTKKFSLDSALGKLYLNENLPQSPTMYKLTVTISDEGRPAQTTIVTVTVILIQMNALTGPRFSNTPYRFSVREGEEANVNSVLSSEASVEYYIVKIKSALSNNGYYFILDKTSGMIRTNGFLDREVTGSQVNLTVCAVNTQSDFPQASLEEVVITINDINDTPPQFTNTSFVKSVGEDLPVGSEILRITVTDPDTTTGTQSLKIVNGSHGNYALNSQTGALTVAKRLDREVRSTDRLTIESSDGTNTAVATVKILITDTNDNAPVFTDVFYSFDIPEDTPIETTVALVEGVDADEGLNGEVVYSLVSTWGQSIFHLDPQMGTIKLIKKVDFEQNHLYTLTVLASDKGSPSQSTSVLVYLNIKDVNDNEPQFNHQAYNGEVLENAAIGTSVLTVQATDIDSGINSKLEYTLLEGNSSSDFSIGTENGTIYTIQNLDRETQSQYTLIVIATDQAEPPSSRKSTTAEVIIAVRDINDNAPEFVTPPQIWVKENATLGSVVYTVRAVDIDEGVNANVMYSLVSHPVFQISPSTGEITLQSPLNRELIQNYTLQVTATDQGTESQSTTQKLQILVEDVNDNPPVFFPSSYRHDIQEDVQIGTTLLRVTATDADTGLNGVVRFFIIRGDNNADFSMDPSNGVLRVQKNLDYERVNRYTLTVQAEDMGVNPRYSVATVTIDINDVNDFQPVFQNSPFYALVRENMADSPPVPVITVSALDLDSSPNSQLTYALREGDKGVTSIFQINSTSGVVTCSQTLDREQVPQYKILVVAIDSGMNRLTGTGTIHVEVEDVNDNTPLFDRSSAYVGHVQENQDSPVDILTVTATDDDSGANAQISYSLVDDVEGKFVINTASGVLTSQKPLDREDTALYHLTVVAKDHGNIARSSNANITVYVDDVNDNVPLFEKQTYNRTLNNPTSSGQFVVGVTAVDRDAGLNGRVTYSLQGPQNCNKFNLDSQRGVITTADFISGAESKFTCTIEARDHGSPKKTSTTTLQVEVSSVGSSNIPLFDAINNPQLPEGSPLDQVVATVRAQPASGSGVIKYSIAGGNVGNTFRIDETLGTIRVAGEVDYEMTPDFHLWIQATEGSNPLLSAYKEVVITVSDQNDNFPRFQEGVYITSVREDVPISTSVFTVSASDADSGDNGRIVYILAGGSVDNIQDTFSVNSNSGEIKTKVDLDRETQDSYNLIVEARDTGSPPKTGTTTVRVTLIDVNDNSPKFTTIFSVNIPEDLPVNSFVIQVTSTDRDIGVNAKAHYRIDPTASQASMFSIDADSGNITLKSQIDRETMSSQRITIPLIAEDGSFSTRGYLHVFVTDVNDNAPQIQPPVTFNFLELQPKGSTVGTITADDKDVSSPNNQFYFSFKLPSPEFAIDDKTGVITSKEELTYIYHKSFSNALNQRELVIIATDLGTPAKSSEAIITIEIIDANDHAPSFEQNLYFSAVPESSSVGERILTVVAKDEQDFGQNAEVEYFIESGNGSSHFFVNKTTGLITVAQPLNGKRNQDFTIIIRAEDKGLSPKSTTVSVQLSITVDNNYTPVFSMTGFSYSIREDAAIGQSVARVTATDQDGSGPNGKVSYYIMDGNSEGLFQINSENGVISVAQALDYETLDIHLLNISARDSGLHYREATAILTVQLIDVNDNPPLFPQSHYDGYIPENSRSDTSIIKIQAKDRDKGENAKIEYYISESGSDQLALTLFKIDKQTGILMTKGNLDYETQTKYSMVVIARNPNDMRSSTIVTVHVTSVNEFYPEFERKTYAFSTKESAANGSVIGNVRATDRDKGIDGIVYYYLIGSSNVKGFSVNYKTGGIYVSGKPDYESSPHVVLNVLAKNWESVKGNDTDTCTVTISVEDANDAPVFTQTLYLASVAENSAGGVSVTTVTAIDRDNLPEDRQFSYRIFSGNEGGEFSIDSASGRIHTTGRGSLDRETTPTHSVVVAAIDRGTPPATGSATVRITLLDENDNSPYLSPSNLTAYVRENLPAGTRVINVADYTSDRDIDLAGQPGNQGPYTYIMSPGNHYNYFSVSSDGQVLTKQTLDREALQGSQYNVIMVARDAGTPTQSATFTFKVIVQDENDSPPQARNMSVQIGIFETTLPTSPVADVRPLDADTIGTYTCTVTDEFYTITQGSGCNLTLRNFHTPPSRTLNVQGSDGNIMVSYKVISTLVYFDNVTLDNVVIIYVDGIEKSNFVKDKLNSFQSTIVQLYSSDHTVTVLNVDSKDTGTLVYVSVAEASGKVVLYDFLKQKLSSNKQNIARAIFPNVANPENRIRIGFSVCETSSCNSGTCLNRILVGSGMNTVDSPLSVLSSPAMVPDFYCICPSQYTGRHCEVPVQPCGGGFCSNGGFCQNGVCQCEEGWTGQYCTENEDECLTNPCENEGTCEDTQGSYTCTCPDGFTGKHCETGSNHCASYPCQNGGQCKNELNGFLCQCRFEYWGNQCQYTSKGFSELSYMEFNSIDQNQKDIDLDMTFSTIRSKGLLLYNPSNTGKFIALEIINRNVRFSFNFGDAKATILTVLKDVSTGDWFRVQVRRQLKDAEMRVTHCPVTSTECVICQTGDTSCYSKGSQSNYYLDLDGHPMYIGGLRDIETIQSRPGQISSHDFVGCIREFKINNVDHLTQPPTPNSQKNILDKCPRNSSSSQCRADTCKNQGQCVEEWEGFSCHCVRGYAGAHCEIAPGPLGFSSNSRVTFVQKESFRRDQIINQSNSRRRRALDTSSVMIRYRTTTHPEPLLVLNTSNDQGVLWVDSGKLVYTFGSKSIVLSDESVHNGDWHNASVSITGDQVTLRLDDKDYTQTLNGVVKFSDVRITKMVMGSSESTIIADNKEFKAFSGCISIFQMDGSSVPLNGSTERFIITPTENVESGCSALCTGNPCGGGTCSVNLETRVCAQVSEQADSLSIGIIVVIVFFGVLLIVIAVVFVLFRMRRQKKDPKSQTRPNENGHVNKSYNNSPPSYQDSGYGEQDFNRQNNLSSPYAPNGLHRPDLINSDPTQRRPYEIDDGTVIIDNGDVNMNQLTDMPEHYDLDNASSIAPSDTDVHMHYRGFRSGYYPDRSRERPHKRHRESPSSGFKSRESPGPGALKLQTSGRLRSSPANNLEVPQIASHSARSSPANVAMRNSPINQLSRQSPQVRASPLTHSNLRGTPVSNIHHNRTESDRSLASHHSKSSTSSSVPRTVMPNGHVKSSKHKYYDSNSRQVKGLTVEEIEKLNARPRRPSPVSLLEAVSSSEEGRHIAHIRMSTINSDVVLVPPESSSEDSANDSFTCSEFEYENEKTKNEFDPNAMIFSKVSEADNEHEDSSHQNRTSQSDGLDSNGGSFASTVGSSEEGPRTDHKLLNGHFAWDYLMNWGPSYEKLVGVFKDIASLPDGETNESREDEVAADCEEYV